MPQGYFFCCRARAPRKKKEKVFSYLVTRHAQAKPNNLEGIVLKLSSKTVTDMRPKHATNEMA
jgi:hypothetical protein